MTGPAPGRAPGRPAGRRPGDPADTRRTILDAARRRFSATGYERATIRAIAADADVDPALLIHHFGTKQQLFVAAHGLPVNPAVLLREAAGLPLRERAAVLTRQLLSMFAEPDSPALSLLRAAATNEDAARMIREVLHEVFEQGGAALTDGDDAELRMTLINSQIVGVVFNRQLLRLPQLASRQLDEIACAIAPAIEHYLSGSLSG